MAKGKQGRQGFGEHRGQPVTRDAGDAPSSSEGGDAAITEARTSAADQGDAGGGPAEPATSKAGDALQPVKSEIADKQRRIDEIRASIDRLQSERDELVAQADKLRLQLAKDDSESDAEKLRRARESAKEEIRRRSRKAAEGAKKSPLDRSFEPKPAWASKPPDYPAPKGGQ